MNPKQAIRLATLLACSTLIGVGCSSAGVSSDIGPFAAVAELDASVDVGASPPPQGPAQGGDIPRPALPKNFGSPLCNASVWMGCYPDRARMNTNDCSPLLDDGGGANLSASGELAAPQACHVQRAATDVGVAPVCLPAGAGTDGMPCTTPTDCAAGYECVGEGRCQPYCCTGDCTRHDQFCDIQPTLADPALRVPVCVPIHACGLLDTDGGTCAPNETCAVATRDGVTSCVAVGPKRSGEECDTDHCEHGLTCLGTSAQKNCYILCHTAPRTTECGATSKQVCKGGMPLFPVPGVGICQ